MLNLNKTFRIAGTILLVVGAFLFINTNITGAVVGISDFSTTYGTLLGFLIIVGGIVLLAMSSAGSLENIVEPEEIIHRLRRIEPEADNLSIIIDSSAILDYTPEQLKQLLQPYKEILMPESVYNEVHNRRIKHILDTKKDEGVLEVVPRMQKNRAKYRDIARKILWKTPKAVIGEKITTYLKDIADSKKFIEPPKEIKGDLLKIRRWLLEDGKKATLNDIEEYVDNHYAVSTTDIDVLAEGLYSARHKHYLREKKELSKTPHTVIETNDTHIIDAIKFIKGENIEFRGGIIEKGHKPYAKRPGIKASIDYVTSLKSKAA